MFDGNPVELGRKGGQRRLETLSPERRTAVATQAAYRRWYKINGTDLEQCEAALRRLSQIAAKAYQEGNDDRSIRTISAMLGWVKFRVWLTTESGHKGGPPLDVEAENDEAAKRLLDARKQRNKALGLEGDETVVEASKPQEAK